MFSVESWPEPAARAWTIAQRFQKFLMVGAVGLAVVRKALAQPGTEVTLKRENETFPARLTHLPFLHEI